MGRRSWKSSPGWRRTKGLRHFQVSRAARDAQGSSCSHRPELPEALPGAALNKDQVNKAAALGRGRGSWSSSGTQGQEAGQQQQQQRVLEAGKEQRPGHSSLGKALSSCRIPSGTGAIGNAQCWLGERGGLTPRCHLLSHLPGVPGGRLSSALPRDGSGHLTCTRAPLWHWEGGSRSSCPCAPAAKLGQLSLHSKGFPVTPDHSGVPSRRRIPGSPSGCPGGVEQTKRCWAVLSCSSQSGDGRAKTSTRNLLLFLPSPSPCETFCAWFFPALQSPVRQDGARDMAAGLGGCGELPSPLQAPSLPVLLQPGLLGKLCCFGTGKGRDWHTGLAPVALPRYPRLLA